MLKKALKKLLLTILAFALCAAMGLSVLAQAAPGEDTPGAAGTPATAGETGGGPAAGAEDAPSHSAPGSSGSEASPAPPAEDTVPPDETGEEPSTDPTSTTPESESETETEDTLEANADPGAGAEADAEAYGLAPNAASLVVSTYAELKKALAEDNDTTTLYLGADITADGTGVTIHPSKRDVVLDGSPPSGGRHSFTQATSGSDTTAIRVTDAAVGTVTLRNMDIAGANPYGVVFVPETVKNVTLVHENVTYTGPQPFYNRGGTVRVAGGGYTLQQTGAIAAGELAEALHAELGGEVTVTAAATGNGILWLTGSASTLSVLPGATVAVNTNYYFLYTGGNTPAVTLGAGAGFSLTSRRWGFTFADHRVASFTMAEEARLFIDLDTTESYAALRVAQLFQMAPGSSATILRTGTAGISLRLTNAGARAVFDRPGRVFLYSAAGVPLRFTGAGSLSVTTGAVNLWKSTGWPLAGGTGALPTHIWNKAGGAALTLTGSYNERANQSLAHNLADDDPVTAPLNAANFDLEGSQLVAFGSLPLSIDTLTTGSGAITGATAPGAALLAAYTPAGGGEETATGGAGGDGRYALGLGEKRLEPDSAATVTAVADGLAARQHTTVQDGAKYRLAFTEVPGQLHFGSLPVPGAQVLASRMEQDFTLSVSDSRLAPSPWRVDASLAAPLAAEGSLLPEHKALPERKALPGAIVFVAGGQALALNEAPMTVYRQGAAGGDATIRWAEDEGILLSLSPGEVYSNVRYTATIHWQLVDAP